MDEKKEIEQFIKDYLKIYFTDRDFEAVKDLFSPNFTCIGTGLDEIGLSGAEAIELYRNDFKELPKPIDIQNLKINLCSVSSNVATVIFTFDINTEINESILYIPRLRNSFTLIKNNNNWKILQSHISVPNNLQVEGEMYPLQKMIEKNELLKQLVADKTKELQIANNELIKSNNTKDKLFSIISHDLKGPFNNLLGFINMLENEYDDLDLISRKNFIKRISANSNAIYSLLNILLTWSRIQRNEIEYTPTSINLNEISNKSIAVLLSLSNDKNITISNNIDESIFVLGDEFMITTIIRNLVSNAIKFTPNFGSITLFLEKVKPPTSKQITVCIQDTGNGIESSKLENLFLSKDMKSTRGTNNEAGTGLGLSICKEFIDYHKTKIWGESQINKGSKFCFNLNFI